MSQIGIRSARASDIEGLLWLMRQYWQYDGIPGFNEGRMRLLLQAFFSAPTYGCGWVAEEHGTLIGYLISTFVYSFEHGGLMAEVDELFVSEVRRGEQLGSRLLTAACRELEEHGCVCLQIQVSSRNGPARRFYSARGFVEKAGYDVWVAPIAAVTRG